jgi:hypothetical protein
VRLQYIKYFLSTSLLSIYERSIVRQIFQNDIVTDLLKVFLGNASVITFARLRNNRRSGVFCVWNRPLPCRAQPHRAFLGDSCKTLITQEWGGVRWPPRLRTYVTLKPVTSAIIGDGVFPRVRWRFYRRDCVPFERVLGGRQPLEVCSWRRPERVNWKLLVSSFQLSDRVFISDPDEWNEVKWS